MSKKVEVVEDKFGIITKQSEVYVWDDKVFASYKAARAAQVSSDLYSRVFKKMYPTYTASQLKTIVDATKASPRSYHFYPDNVLAVVTELLAEAAE